MIYLQVLCVITAAYVAAFGWRFARGVIETIAERRALARRNEVRRHIELERRAHCRSRLP
jgi:hypothetical protein